MIKSKKVEGTGSRADSVGYRPKYAVVHKREARRISSAQMRTRIIISLCVVFAVESCIALTTSPWMYIRSVRLSGLARLLPEEAAQVRAFAVVSPKTNLLRADTRKLEREL